MAGGLAALLDDVAMIAKLTSATSTKAMAVVIDGDIPLTEREVHVLREARSGQPVAQLAKALSLSPGTVRNHLSSAIAKTGARTRAEAARIATERGWL